MATSRYLQHGAPSSPLGNDENPNLPHFRKNRQQARVRPQNFSRDSHGFVYEKFHRPAELDAREMMINRALDARRATTEQKEDLFQTKTFNQTKGTFGGTTGGLSMRGELELPYEVQTDKQVLRAFAYTQETVPDSTIEQQRVRQVVILCYVVDQTFEVFEPKQDNAGLEQGKVLKRHRIPRQRLNESPSRKTRPQPPSFTTKASRGIGKPSMDETMASMRIRTTTPSSVVGRSGMFALQSPNSTNGRRNENKDTSEDDTEYYDWSDLIVGNELLFYGKMYHIYDVDQFTRDWFAARDIEQDVPESVPEDAMARQRTQALQFGPKKQGGHNKKMYPVKEFMEARRGKFIRDPRRRKQFQDNDGKVLRFDCISDEQHREGGDVNQYHLNYYLADDEADVRVVHKPNDGQDRFPCLLRKQPLPKNWERAMAAGSDAARVHPELFMRPEDIRIGQVLNVFGHQLFIRACDPFTRAWYEEHDIPQPPSAYRVEEPEPERAIQVPPHNGFGDEDDALQNVYKLVPKPHKKDFNKWIQNDGTVFKFRCKFAEPSTADAPRRFTISVYPSDDTISIYEPSLRNTGVIGGKFLSRGKHKRSSDNVLYADLADQFIPGHTVNVAGWKWLILDADNSARAAFPSVDTPSLEVHFNARRPLTPPDVVRQREQEKLAEFQRSKSEQIAREREAGLEAERMARTRARQQAQDEFESRSGTVNRAMSAIDDLVQDTEGENPTAAGTLKTIRSELARAATIDGMLRIVEQRRRGAMAAGRDGEVQTLNLLDSMLSSLQLSASSPTATQNSTRMGKSRPVPSMYRTANGDYGK